MRTTKILFLDFDHVLNTSETLARGELFEKTNIDALNTILDATDVNVVVTSMWRLGAKLEELEAMLVEAGVHVSGRVIGSTPCLGDCPRGKEIMAWLEQAQEPVIRFVILDDRSDMEAYTSRLVKTDPRVGLVQTQVDEVINILMVNNFNAQT